MSPAWRSHALSRYHLMSSFLNFQYPLFSCPWFQTQPKSSLYLINVSQGWAIWGRSKGTGAQRLASQAHLSVPSVLQLAVLFRYVISNPCCHPSFLLFVLGCWCCLFSFLLSLLERHRWWGPGVFCWDLVTALLPSRPCGKGKAKKYLEPILASWHYLICKTNT